MAITWAGGGFLRVLVVPCATLAVAEDFVENRLRGRRNTPFPARLAAVQFGVPLRDALHDLTNALDQDLLSACVTAQVHGLRQVKPDIVALDGKTSRRARRGDAQSPHVVGAWAARRRLVWGRQGRIARAIPDRDAGNLLARKDKPRGLADEVASFLETGGVKGLDEGSAWAPCHSPTLNDRDTLLVTARSAGAQPGVQTMSERRRNGL